MTLKSIKNRTNITLGTNTRIFEELSLHVHPKTKTCPKKVPKQGWEKWWNFGLEGPLASRLVPGAGNGSTRPFWTSKLTSKLSQNGTFWIRNHSNTSGDLRMGWNREGNPKVVSEQKMARVPSMQIAFFLAKRPHSTQRAKEVSWKNRREFRLCKR